MKKLIIVIAFLAIGLISEAQINDHALGVRLGGGNYFGGELSYQKALGSNNRLELDFGFNGKKDYSRLAVIGIYQWHWNLNQGLNWYAGPGGSVGLYSDKGNDGYLNIALGGQVGIEYNFNGNGVPLLLSLDIRPMWDFLGDNPGLGWGVAIGIRYTWN